MNNRAKVSIVTVVRNNQANIESCIQSVVQQTYADIEYIVVDGGSTDGTLDVIREYSGKISSWISGPDDGIYDAMNKGLNMVTGEIVGFLHSDDCYNNERVVADVADAFARSNVESVYGDLLYVNAHSGRPVRYWKSREYKDGLLRWGWMPPHPTFFVLRKVYQQHGYFDTRFKISADYDLMLRFLGKQKVATYYIPKVLVRMRLGGESNKTLRNIVRKSWEDYKVTKLHGLKPGFLVVMFKNLSKLQQFFLNRRRFGTQSTHPPETA